MMCQNMKTYKEVFLEMRTIKRDEFLDWFRQIGGIESDDGFFEGPFWKAYISEASKVKLGAMDFPVVYMRILVEDEQFENFMKAFRLRFLRAGG
ncbi:hypothetical protein [Acetomicrobium flavidum]|uniref:hypothetical protein n=1 Tax=Acetomicrobium flavidum TaxID=49896 RepID=UPI00298A029D